MKLLFYLSETEPEKKETFVILNRLDKEAMTFTSWKTASPLASHPHIQQSSSLRFDLWTDESTSSGPEPAASVLTPQSVASFAACVDPLCETVVIGS